MFKILILLVSGVAGQPLSTCTDRYGSVALDVFNHRSCTLCYAYMFQQTQKLFPMGENMDSLGPRPGMETDSDSEFTSPIYPDIQNQTTTDMICRTLTEDNCERWKSCCHDALECCERQMDTTSPVIDGYCPRQWDGWTCWEDTPSNTDVFQSCPGYIEGFDPERKYQWCANPCISCWIRIQVPQIRIHPLTGSESESKSEFESSPKSSESRFEASTL